jgi:PAS domain S-box-containing protein
MAAKILVIDDHDTLRRTTVRILERADFEVDQASRGQEGLDLIRAFKPDLVLLDVVLGDEDGRKICQEIKSDPAYAGVYVILLSGKMVSTSQRAQGLEGGADDYIVRPVSQRELLARINAILRLKEVERRLRRERDLLRQITDTSPVAITVVDASGQITFANDRAEQILGLKPDRITGRTYNDPEWKITGYDGEPFPEEKLPFSIMRETLEPVYNRRHAIQWPTGRRVLLRINGAPLLDEQGDLERCVFTLEDVTFQVQAARRQQSEVEQEIDSLDQLSSQCVQPADLIADASLFQRHPDLTEGFLADYARVIDLALEQRVYKVEHPISEQLRDLAEQLGCLQAGPRDVVELHSRVLEAIVGKENPHKLKAYAEEGRLVALELLGYLTAYYRNLYLGIGADER